MDRERRRSACCFRPDPTNLNRSGGEHFLPVVNYGQPSSVYIFSAKPRGSRTVSAEPFSPARTTTLVFFIFHSRQNLTDGGETHQYTRFTATFEDLCLADIGDIVQGFEETKGTTPTRTIDRSDQARREKQLTLWRVPLVQEYVLDRIVAHLQCMESPRAAKVLVPRQ